MPEWLAVAIKEGGFFALAIFALALAGLVFREYLKLVNVVLQMQKDSTTADVKLLSSVERLTAVVEARNAAEAIRRGK
jgi:uncharacterized membrane-anchored protein